MRYLVLALVLVACTRPAPVAPQQPAPAPVVDRDVKPENVSPAPPTNLVCEAFKGVNPQALCAPHHTDVGELHIHTATITLQGQQLACRQDTTMLGVLCSDPIVIKQQPPPPTVDKAPTKKKGAKK